MAYSLSVITKVDTPDSDNITLFQPGIGTNYVWSAMFDNLAGTYWNWDILVRTKSTLAIAAHHECDFEFDWFLYWYTGCCQGDYFFVCGFDMINEGVGFVLQAWAYSGGVVTLKDQEQPTNGAEVVACNANRIYAFSGAHGNVYTFNGTSFTAVAINKAMTVPAGWEIQDVWVDSDDYVYAMLIKAAGEIAKIYVYHWNSGTGAFDDVAHADMSTCACNFNSIWSDNHYVYAVDYRGLCAYHLDGGTLTYVTAANPRTLVTMHGDCIGYSGYIFYTCGEVYGTTPLDMYAYTFDGATLTEIAHQTVVGEYWHWGIFTDGTYIWTTVEDPSDYPSIVKWQLTGTPPVISSASTRVEIID